MSRLLLRTRWRKQCVRIKAIKISEDRHERKVIWLRSVHRGEGDIERACIVQCERDPRLQGSKTSLDPDKSDNQLSLLR